MYIEDRRAKDSLVALKDVAVGQPFLLNEALCIRLLPINTQRVQYASLINGMVCDYDSHAASQVKVTPVKAKVVITE